MLLLLLMMMVGGPLRLDRLGEHNRGGSLLGRGGNAADSTSGE